MQVYLVDILSGMGHVTEGHAGILKYTINVSVDIHVYTSCIPGVTGQYVCICILNYTCFRGSMEGHASYMTHVSGEAWGAMPVI